MVTFLVGTGSEQKTFVLNKKELYNTAAVFSKMFNSSFNEGFIQRATLPGDDPSNFSLFQRWISDGRMSVLPANSVTEAKVAVSAMIKMFGFAEKYGIEHLCD
jgi:hypothetical protein